MKNASSRPRLSIRMRTFSLGRLVCNLFGFSSVSNECKVEVSAATRCQILCELTNWNEKRTVLV